MFNRLKDTVLFTATLAAVAFVAAAIPASAATPEDPTTQEIRHVQTADLNLASPADVKRLRHRIATAARQVCDDVTDPVNYNDPDYAACVKTSTDAAWVQAERLVASAGGQSLVASAGQQ